MNDPELLTVSQVAEACNATNQTIRNWIRAGRLNSVRIGNRFLIPRQEVDRLRGDARARTGESPWDYARDDPAGPLPRKAQEREPDADPTEGLLGV
jgi:excisionase family DNA binding protein